ncbi:MAG: hypothetical protein B7Y16_00345 [Methylotenera sp. 24-45-7]|jgi:hypothetical protein|nr:MAG: hypothetical protein B7Y72_07545 [Mehylophilales bacterium 35-46-6]OYY84645.1 MAG: hypothetical protein B7Y34_00150 [Methylophilales bacterium 16-45-9]OYZ41907.1 MAG: hypothetical protein B7Y16_00345 [Methylotenera sp. 24-45-7]OZA08851.1 MAG: hypothetical protein B7X97_04790 [Methylotenera sp. 17-45-7]HQS43323.1 hypothetical protein [Methylotenera sp.]
MFYQSLKKLSWIIVFWFALLQAITPFIHTHLGAEHLTETPSMHIHVDEHEHSTDQNNSHFVSDVSHTITVASGLITDLDNSLTLFAVVFVLFFLSGRINIARWIYPDFNFLHDYSLKRRRPAPRAPPQL